MSACFHNCKSSETMESQKGNDVMTEEQQQSNYHKMLNNIASDLDLLLHDLCHIYPHPDQAQTNRFQTFGKGQYTDTSPGVGEDSAFGTLASTDSYACEQKLRSDSLQSGHLDVFGLEEKGLQIPTYPQVCTSDPQDEPRCISFEERLTKTYPIWYLPEIGRSGAVHLLKDREPGTFIIRNSSQPSTMALSAQFPEKGQANVDHYLIQHSDRGYRVQGSLHFFKSIPDLIVHYHEHVEELPCRLVLPPTIRRAKTLQELTSLSYLGQDFWTSYRFDRGVFAYNNFSPRNLHKSTSEPVNITQASHFPSSSPKVARIMPSKSMQQFSNISESPLTSSNASTLEKSSPSLSSVNHSGSESENNLVTFGVGNEKDARKNRSDTCIKCKAKMKSTQTRSEDNIALSGSSSEKVSSLEWSMANTHPRTQTKDNSNLYFTTSIELLNNSENQYFHSNLSDKMSDYEDIWKHSTSATPVPSVKSHGVNIQPPAPFGMFATEVQVPHENKPKPEPVYSKPDKSAMKTKGSKKDLGSKPQTLLETTHNDFSAEDSQQMTVSSSQTNLQSEEKDSDSKCNIRRTISLEDYKIKNAKRSDSLETETLDVKSTASVHTQTSPKMKIKPAPIPSVDNDASSTSTVPSSVKSPVYAEPFDSLVSAKDKNRKSKLRRRSAPSMGFSARKVKGVSQTPNLETIFSPKFDHKNTKSLHESFNFKDNEKPGANEDLPPSGLRRTQSAKVRYSNEPVPALTKESLDKVVQKLEKLSVHRLHSESEGVELCAPPKAKVDRKIGAKSKGKLSEPSAMCNISSAQNDLMWEELSKEEREVASSTLRKFPVYKRHVSRSDSSSADESSTIEDVISSMNPAFTLKPMKLVNPLLRANHGAHSEYDNLTNQYTATSHKSHASTGTIFCKPWENSNLFEALMDPKNCKLPPPMDVNERIHAWQAASEFEKDGNTVRDSLFSDSTIVDETDLENLDTEALNTPAVFINPPSDDGNTPNVKGQHSHSRQGPHVKGQGHRGFTYSSEDENVPSFPIHLPGLKQTVLPTHPAHSGFLQNKLKSTHPDSKIEEYICRLSHDHSTTFGSTIENFIQCTLESQETNPHHVTRNVRQFMTGIRNYLVKHGEGELEDIIERERTRLRADEILNIDAIIERALHTCVLRPLKHHVYSLFVDEYTRNGSLSTLSMNMKYARTKSAEDIGLRPDLSPPEGAMMELIKLHLTKMQKSFSPLKKLENLLCATSCIYKCVSSGPQRKSGQVSMGADDFLPMLIYVLVHCGMVAVEIEVDYMWGLLQPSVLNGEGGYYLTSLSSAVLVLKNFRSMHEQQNMQQEGRYPSISDMQGFLKIAIPNELRDTIIWKTLPVRPNMTTKDVCSMIAHKFKITNPQDYGLYILVRGEETRMGEMDCPQLYKIDHLTQGRDCVFAYKRNEANIAWPMSLKKHIAAS